MSRVNCPSCGSHTGLGSYKCFKCGYTNKHYSKNFIFDHLGIDKDNQNNIEVPKDIIFNPREFHVDALKWLYGYQIYDNLIKENKIGYMPSWHRVFLPNFRFINELTSYQLRSLSNNNDDIKYLTFGKQHTVLLHNHFNSTLVIVEDRVSSIRLAEHDNVLCLLGTYLPSDTITHILEDFDTFIFWLDADRPGQIAKNKIFKQITNEYTDNIIKEAWGTGVVNRYKDFYMVNHKNITKDPKAYTDYEIEYILNNELLPMEY